MRAFIAVELPDQTKQELVDMAAQLRRSGVRASWVRPERMHLTLRFLGEIGEDQAEAAGEFLASAYAGRDVFECRLHGAGAFPNARRPNVLWAGIAPLEGGLAETQAVAEEAAQRIGLKAERRSFHPHLTLGRIRRPEKAGDVSRALRPLAEFCGAHFLVDGASLFSSTLTPDGPIYERIRECRF